MLLRPEPLGPRNRVQPSFAGAARSEATPSTMQAPARHNRWNKRLITGRDWKLENAQVTSNNGGDQPRRVNQNDLRNLEIERSIPIHHWSTWSPSLNLLFRAPY